MRMQEGEKKEKKKKQNKTGTPRRVTPVANKAAPLVMQARHEKGRGGMEKMERSSFAHIATGTREGAKETEEEDANYCIPPAEKQEYPLAFYKGAC